MAIKDQPETMSRREKLAFILGISLAHAAIHKKSKVKAHDIIWQLENNAMLAMGPTMADVPIMQKDLLVLQDEIHNSFASLWRKNA